MYKLILFDLDGTLLDTDPMLKVTFEELFKKYRPDYHPDESHFYEFSGPPITLTLKREFPNMDQDFILKEFRELSYVNYDKYSFPFPGIDEMISALKEKDIKYGVVTNKARKATTKAFALFGLDKYFDFSITSNDIVNQKPDPEGVYKAMKHFGITNKKEVLYIGDMIYDYNTARNSGVDFGYVLWSPRKLPSDAKIDVKVQDYKDFAEKIRNGKI